MNRTILTTALLVLAACGASTVRDEKGRKLTLVAPASQTLSRGDTDKIMLAISRKGFEGPVEIRFEALPAGVTVVESKTEIPAADSTATFTLHASNEAAVVENSAATVTAVGPGGMSASEQFKVTVKAPK